MSTQVQASDSMPGIGRRKAGRRWAYFDAEGERITNRDEIDRLNRIGLPPAYADAWFSPDPKSHILATGIDARGRRQYRYHPDFIAARDAIHYGSGSFAESIDYMFEDKTDLARRLHETQSADILAALATAGPS